MYLLVEYSPTEDLTGGAWYTDNEFDVSFIEQLSIQIFKYIAFKTLTEVNGEIYYYQMEKWPNSSEVLEFIISSKITTSNLHIKDVQTLLKRLHLDGKIKRSILVNNSNKNQSSEINEDLFIYAATAKNYNDAGHPYPFYGIPCKNPSKIQSTNNTTNSLSDLINCSNLAMFI